MQVCMSAVVYVGVWYQGYCNLCYCSTQIRALGGKHYPNWSFGPFFSPRYVHRLNFTCYEAHGTELGSSLAEWEFMRLHIMDLILL